MTDEFLELLWVLEAALAMEPELTTTLDAVVSGSCFKEGELPQPSDEQREAPKASEEEAQEPDQLSLLDDEDDDDEEESELLSARLGIPRVKTKARDLAHKSVPPP